MPNIESQPIPIGTQPPLPDSQRELPEERHAQEGAPRKRQPYVKPMVRQLQYMVDQHVSLAAGCKTVGSVTGPTFSDCKSSLNAPCAATTS